MRGVTWSGALAMVSAVVPVALMFTGYRNDALLGLGFIPARVSGALLPPEVASLPAWLTPLSAPFVAWDLISLVIGVGALVLCASLVERDLGGPRTLAIYAVAAFCGAAAYWLESPMQTYPLVGPLPFVPVFIGAIAMLRSTPKHPGLGGWTLQGVGIVGAWSAICVGMGFASGDAGSFEPGWIAYLASFVPGVLLARPLLRWRLAVERRA